MASLECWWLNFGLVKTISTSPTIVFSSVTKQPFLQDEKPSWVLLNFSSSPSTSRQIKSLTRFKERLTVQFPTANNIICIGKSGDFKYAAFSFSCWNKDGLSPPSVTIFRFSDLNKTSYAVAYALSSTLMASENSSSCVFQSIIG